MNKRFFAWRDWSEKNCRRLTLENLSLYVSSGAYKLIRGSEETLLAAVCAGCVVLLALDAAVQNFPGGEHRSPDIEQPFPVV
jgi:hypothetical protein